jgi:hypothetical protein
MMIHLAHQKKQSFLSNFPEAVFILNPVRHVEDYYLHMLFRDFSDFVKM